MFKVLTVMFLPFVSVIIFALAFFRKEKKAMYFLPLFFASALAAVTVCSLLQIQLHRIMLLQKSRTSEILFSSFIQSALPEEVCKLFFFLLSLEIYGKMPVTNYFKRLRHGKGGAETEHKAKQEGSCLHKMILLSVFSGLTFAAFENIAYAAADFYTLAVRTVSAVFIHAGTAVYYAKIAGAESKKKAALLFLPPFLMHGLYNMFINLGGFFYFFAASAVFFSISVSVKNIFKEE